MKIFLTILILFFFSEAKADTTVCGRLYKDTTQITSFNESNKTYRRLRVKNNIGNSIQITNGTNIKVEDCIVEFSSNNGIVLTGTSNNCVIRLNYIFNISGRCIYFNSVTGVNNRVDSNVVRNTNDIGGVSGVIQFNIVNAGGQKIRSNYIISEDAFADGGDIINLITSVGTSGNHIIVRDNYETGINGEESSAGIQVDQNSGFVDVINNTLNQSGAKGIACFNSNDINFDGNKVYGACVAGITNVGAHVEGTCINVTIQNTKLLWFCGSDACRAGPVCSPDVENPTFFPCTPTQSGNDFSYDNVVNELQPSSGAQYAYDYWFDCTEAGNTGIGIIISPPPSK